MAKKKKNHQHTEALRRKKSAVEEMSRFGLKIEDDIVLIGFIFNHLAVSHLTYLGIESINKICKTYVGLDICIFSQHLIPPCVSLSCSVLNLSNLSRWPKCPLISTSIGTTLEALSSNASVIYHYAFDPEFIDQPHIESPDMQSAFCDPRIRVVVRDQSHKELIEKEFGISVCDIIVPDCDAELLVKLALTGDIK